MNSPKLIVGNYYKLKSRIHKSRFDNIILREGKEVLLTNELLIESINNDTIDYESIELTTDWFLKFDFDFIEKEQGFSVFKKSFLEFSETPNGFEFFLEGKFIRVKSVHHLQNIYFALTEKELCVKEEYNYLQS